MLGPDMVKIGWFRFDILRIDITMFRFLYKHGLGVLSEVGWGKMIP